MELGLIRYLPLALLIVFAAFCAYLVWRGNYKLGAWVVQVVAALFLSSVGGMGLYVMSVVMVTTWIFPGNLTFLMFNTIVTQAVGATLGFALVKRFGTSTGQLKLTELAASLVLAIIGAWVGFELFRDVRFAADFVDNASSVSGAYFGAVVLANSPLMVVGFIRVLQNHEP